MRPMIALLAACLVSACGSPDPRHESLPDGAPPAPRYDSGWLSWRGPDQNGTSREVGLIDSLEVGGENHLWSYELSGRGTPTIAGGRVYALGYEGKGKDLREVLVCLDEETGAPVWERRVNDFLSDIIYDRYSIGSPTIDRWTGNIYWLTSAGVLKALDSEGELLWEHALGSEFGRLSFPNGRTGAPLLDGDLAIVHVISAAWGPLGPARDRYYAFDKLTGESIWVSTPGEGPKDSSFCFPVVEWRDGRRLLYGTTGCGNAVAVDALTGEPVWRYKLSIGGANSDPVIHGDQLIAIHGKENVDSTTHGRMVAIPLGRQGDGPVLMGSGDEVWRADLAAFTSSPVLVGDRVYETVATGELVCVDANDGRILWKDKLGPDQIHASPVWGDGKLFVPMTNGSFHVLRPSDTGAEHLADVQLGGSCLGAPAIANGKVFVHTTERLYCFGRKGGAGAALPPVEEGPPRGAAVRARVLPADVTVAVGEDVPLRVQLLDAHGYVVGDATAEAAWKPVPHGVGEVEADAATTRFVAHAPRAFVLAASVGELPTTPARVRVVASAPFIEDFEGIELTEGPPDAPFAWPPSSWIGARPKWDVRELDGNKVFAKTLTNPLFQRSQFYLGDPNASNYTVQVDVMTDGNRRILGSMGVLHQRYLIQLRGNYQDLEVTSNYERIKEEVPFKIKPKVWYRLKTRVDVAADGSGVVRAKAWPRDEAEPAGWLIEVEHAHAHDHGAPGLFGFAPQSRFKVYLDNLVVTPNE